jgi:hypothetical protein
VPHGRVYKAQRGSHLFHLKSLAPLHSGDASCNTPHTNPPQEVGYYASQSSPNLQKITCLSLSCSEHEPLSYIQQHCPTQKAPQGYPWVCGQTLNTDRLVQRRPATRCVVTKPCSGFGHDVEGSLSDIAGMPSCIASAMPPLTYGVSQPGYRDLGVGVSTVTHIPERTLQVHHTKCMPMHIGK